MGSGSKVASRESLIELRRSWRQSGLVVVFTNGCFDLLHPGHLALLEGAHALGDLLVVGVNSDRSVRGLKGHHRAIIPANGRAALLAGFACVDCVVVFDEPTAVSLVAALQPDIYVKGGDYTMSGASAPPEARIVASYGGRTSIIPSLPGYSTTDLVRKIRGG